MIFRYKIIGFLLSFLINFSIQSLDNKYLCTERFCQNYVDTIGCPKLDVACRVQNSTHNGRLFDSPTPCNCCEFCLENLKQGEWCTIGTPGSPLPGKICGPGLYCVAHEGQHATCESMRDSKSTPCYTEQDKFDKDKETNKIGNYRPRPKCDKDGFYEPIRCVSGQTCHCLNEDGNRIFGESVENEAIEFHMKCECSRLADAARKVIEPQFPIATARCDQKGSFDAIQCMNNLCFCTDPNGGLNGEENANITRGISGIPCYNKTLHRYWRSMEHYLKPCEAEAIEKYAEIKEMMKESHVLSFDVEECQPDGWYLPVRVNKVKGTKYCADEQGEVIEKFEAKIEEAEGMECKCARSRSLLKEANALEIPACDSLGNYPPSTCRRGLCFCQDQDGLQSSHEVELNDLCTLSCCPKGKCGC